MAEITKNKGRERKDGAKGRANTNSWNGGRQKRVADEKEAEIKADVAETTPIQKDDKDSYTKEENKAALLAQIDEIEYAYTQGWISFKDKSAQISAIRFRLQDKFELEKSDKERRIIVVPAKHLFICKYTNRECSNMPPKEVCMKYYNLVEKDKK